MLISLIILLLVLSLIGYISKYLPIPHPVIIIVMIVVVLLWLSQFTII
jgi:hypothetical protein